MPAKRAPVKVKKEEPIAAPEPVMEQKPLTTWCEWAEQQTDPRLALQQMGVVFSEYSKYLEQFFGSKTQTITR